MKPELCSYGVHNNAVAYNRRVDLGTSQGGSDYEKKNDTDMLKQ